MNRTIIAQIARIFTLVFTVICSLALAFLAVLSYEEYYHMLRLQGEVSFHAWINLMLTNDSLGMELTVVGICIVVILAYLFFSKEQYASRYVLVAALLTIGILCLGVLLVFFALCVPALFEKEITFVTILTDRITLVCFPLVVICTVLTIAIIKRTKC